MCNYLADTGNYDAYNQVRAEFQGCFVLRVLIVLLFLFSWIILHLPFVYDLVLFIIVLL